MFRMPLSLSFPLQPSFNFFLFVSVKIKSLIYVMALQSAFEFPDFAGDSDLGFDCYCSDDFHDQGHLF